MNDSQTNPYEPSTIPSLPVARPAWGCSSLIVLGLWFALALTVVVGGPRVQHLYEDFDVSMPVGTRWMLHPATAVLMALAFVVVLVCLLRWKPGNGRRWFVVIAGCVGVLMSLICFVVFVVPLVQLWFALS